MKRLEILNNIKQLKINLQKNTFNNFKWKLYTINVKYKHSVKMVETGDKVKKSKLNLCN